MALSKQDFMKQGFDAAQNTAAMNPGHEDSMPIFGEGNSWQAKAFAEGFRQGVAARHERNKGLQKGEMVVMTAKTDAGKTLYKPAQSARDTAMKHLQFLAVSAADEIHAGRSGGKRHIRLNAKVEKLSAKWGF